MRTRWQVLGAACALLIQLVAPRVLLATGTDDPATGKLIRPTHRVSGLATKGPVGYTPNQIRHAYGFDSLLTAAPGAPNDGAGQVIAIVDAFDAPTIASDLQKFSGTFGLRQMNGLPGRPACTVAAGPHPCFQKLTPQGKPNANGTWALETSLDVEWAHVIAPGADILLVESRDAGLINLLGAVDSAVSSGAGVVTMSWGGGEFSGESALDVHFNRPGVTFLAAAGDSGTGVIYPAVSPFVIAVGGTTLSLDVDGNLVAPETAWKGSGGGISAIEAEPAYQSALPIPATNGQRGVPDVAYNADPATGFAVYDTTSTLGQTGWFKVGGTSAGAPQWAGLIALANQARTAGRLASNNLAKSPLYAAAADPVYGANYRDVAAGTNGTCGPVCTAGVRYDFVTGLGSPLANRLVRYLASQ